MELLMAQMKNTCMKRDLNIYKTKGITTDVALNITTATHGAAKTAPKRYEYRLVSKTIIQT